MIEAGVDLWGGQPELNDFEKLAEQYKDAPIYFGFAPVLPEDASEKELYEIGRQWVLRHKDHHVTYMYMGFANPAFKRGVYACSRELFANE